MSIALVSSTGNVPIFAQGVNTENSFYTDAPSITAAAGFVNMLSDLDGMQSIKINGFALFIHDYKRSESKVAFNSATAFYLNKNDLVNPPVPLELFNADMRFSIIIDYEGSLPFTGAELEDLLNYKTRRFNGGTVINDIMINDVNESEMADYFKRNQATQVIDKSNLNITTFEQIIEYMAFYKNPVTGKRDVRLHNGVFYAHQVGYQLLEDPTTRNGSLLNGDDKCKHAYCEPIINLAELVHTSKLKGFDDLSLWSWEENAENKTILLKEVH